MKKFVNVNVKKFFKIQLYILHFFNILNILFLISVHILFYSVCVMFVEIVQTGEVTGPDNSRKVV